ncbi:hypothetical protein D3C77_403490 [compost metagenome]
MLRHALVIGDDDGRLSGEARQGRLQRLADVAAGQAVRRRRSGRGVVRPVQFIGQTRHQFAQALGGGGRLAVAQLQQALELSRGQALGEGPGLARRRLDHHHLVEHRLRRDGARAPIVESGRPLPRQQQAGAGANLDPADGPAGDADVHQAGQLVDQGRLGGLGARGVGVDHRGLGDFDVQLLDLLQQAVGRLDRALDAGVGVLAHGLNVSGDARRVVEQGLRLPDGFLAQRPRGRVLGRGGEGGEDAVDLREEAAVRARVAEQRLDAVIELIAHRLPSRVRGGVQAGRLQEAVGGQADARDLDPRAHALAGPGLLVGDLSHIAGRVDVGDVVRNHPQLRLGRIHARGGDVHDRGQGHQAAPLDPATGAAPGKACRRPRKSCPAF